MGGLLGKSGKYSEDGIKRRYDKMPRLTPGQKKLLKSSWIIIKTKVNKV